MADEDNSKTEEEYITELRRKFEKLIAVHRVSNTKQLIERCNTKELFNDSFKEIGLMLVAFEKSGLILPPDDVRKACKLVPSRSSFIDTAREEAWLNVFCKWVQVGINYNDLDAMRELGLSACVKLVDELMRGTKSAFFESKDLSQFARALGINVSE